MDGMKGKKKMSGGTSKPVLKPVTPITRPGSLGLGLNGKSKKKSNRR